MDCFSRIEQSSFNYVETISKDLLLIIFTKLDIRSLNSFYQSSRFCSSILNNQSMIDSLRNYYKIVPFRTNSVTSEFSNFIISYVTKYDYKYSPLSKYEMILFAIESENPVLLLEILKSFFDYSFPGFHLYQFYIFPILFKNNTELLSTLVSTVKESYRFKNFWNRELELFFQGIKNLRCDYGRSEIFMAYVLYKSNPKLTYRMVTDNIIYNETVDYTIRTSSGNKITFDPSALDQLILDPLTSDRLISRQELLSKDIMSPIVLGQYYANSLIFSLEEYYNNDLNNNSFILNENIIEYFNSLYNINLATNYILNELSKLLMTMIVWNYYF